METVFVTTLQQYDGIFLCIMAFVVKMNIKLHILLLHLLLCGSTMCDICHIFFFISNYFNLVKKQLNKWK